MTKDIDILKTKVIFTKDPFSMLKDLGRNILIVTDENLASIYRDKLIGFDFFIMESGEKSKSIHTLEHLEDKAQEMLLDKSSLIVAFGGGIVGDLAGFFASIYKRGIPLISIPTTLLAMVDSSIGGKNGVNTRNGKNQLGTIYLPEMILVDESFLDTLPMEDLASGKGEVLKYALLDTQLHDMVLGKESMSGIIYRCMEIKKKFVEEDLEDKGIRQMLNLGHTSAHAIEYVHGLSHGMSVAIGLYMELGRKFSAEITNLADALELTIPPLEPDIDAMEQYMLRDKKVSGKEINLPLLDEIGKYKVERMDFSKFMERLRNNDSKIQ